MFRTSQRAEIPTSALYGDEFRLWTFVEHSLHTPWFYVTVADCQPGQAFHTMFLVQEVHALEALLASQNAVMKVTEVQLVSPSHMNKNDRWLMEPLLELVQIDCQGAHRYEYCVEGGKWYADHMEEALSGGKREPRRIIFQRTQQ
ncbi:TPA: hypothetical protein NH808_000102 [Pseudomonas aeruginosa]|uniref:hypothetical protein n=1 Tax=Pseudomonas aeruginosa TaxID=287 RepID=UPI000F84DF46|nr:hypothetical protein [Pseudomonas aeruginosa]EIU5250136.1 hypothetical protein [Pseudomonas aeruginosa]MBG6348600.1 hypothetical protein [Pseudomonas aeruginosa]MBG6541491.1 hypothetical protein [Pseudomonas aeruginosa]MBH4417620.1 hypothetical protein [Pseudomonas aeruginosa]MBH8650221.1 hypothetical protein [Pseudomonas aeruginosa]